MNSNSYSLSTDRDEGFTCNNILVLYYTKQALLETALSSITKFNITANYQYFMLFHMKI